MYTKDQIKKALLESPTQEDIKNADKHASIIVLSQGILEDGNPYYAYVAIPPSRYGFFKLAESQGDYDLNDYGEILHFEKQPQPSPAVMQMMQEKYGINHNFEALLKEAANETLN